MNWVHEHFIEAVLFSVCIGLIAGAVYVGYFLVQTRNAEQAACLASGRQWVVDHYTTVLIPVKSGKVTTFIPTQVATYKCVE